MNQSELDATLDAGIEAHAAGNFQAARQCYELVLTAFPNDPDALHLLGVLANQRGEFQESIRLIEKAISFESEIAEYHNNLGESFSAVERFDDAILSFLESVKREPLQPNPWRKLGLLHQSKGLFDGAAKYFENASKLDPAHVETLNNLGVAYRHLGRFGDAERVFRNALAIDPLYDLGAQNLSRSLCDQKRVEESLAVARSLVERSPENVSNHIFLARMLNAARKFSEAIDVAHHALKLNIDAAEAHYQLGVAFEGIGEHHGAVLAYNRTAQLEPKRFAPQMNLGLALLTAGDVNRAIEAFEAGTRINESLPQLWHNLTVAHERRGNYAEAIRTAKRLVELSPGDAKPLAILGTMYMRAAQYEKAISSFEEALNINPNMSEAFNNLANVHAERGNIQRAVELAKKAVASAEGNYRPYGVMLMFMNADPDQTPSQLFQAHLDFQRLYADSISPMPPDNNDDPDRKLKIAYISADLRAHSVAFFMSSIFSFYDRSRFEVHCYDNSAYPDKITQQLRKHVNHWHRIVGDSDEEVARKIREHQIDILVDLSGHTADNRLLVMARRPAPIQVSYLGYPNTTGLTSIDYRITDAYADPPGVSDQYCTEKLTRLPNTFLCYSNVPDVPPPCEPPSLVNGYITFASFNVLNKLNRQVIALWSKILHEVPHSRLMLKAGGLSDPDSHAQIQHSFLQEGIPSDRLILRGKQSTYGTHLKMYEEVDIGLDPFPYNGTTTTCEALWTGVPVITLAGNTHVSRVGVSLLANLGLTDLIASTPEEYVQISATLAADASRMKQLRSTMRRRMENSPLMNGQEFAKNMDQAFLEMWATWCEGGSRQLPR